MKLFESVLMRTSMLLYKMQCKSRYTTEAIQHAYSTLAGVCYNWRQTMNGWPESTTKHWFKHQLRQVAVS